MGSLKSTTKVGFLACAETLPADLGGAVERRGDAFEHDLEVAALRPAFALAGLKLVEIDWRAPLEHFEGFRLILLGTAWDYQDDAQAFAAKLEAIEALGPVVCNSSEIVRWNLDKQYLRGLAEAGVPTVPTRWCDSADATTVDDAFDHFDIGRVVVKRQIGAGGMGQHSFTRDAPPSTDWRMDRPVMVQPFLPSILEEGEFTLLFIDGEYSHAVRKCAAEGEYRIQSLYGGTEHDYEPSPEDIASAKAAMAALPFERPLYARIDMIRLPSGALAVMEAEMIEPYLYPEQGPELGERLARAILRRI